MRAPQRWLLVPPKLGVAIVRIQQTVLMMLTMVFVQIVIEWDWIADHVLINAILAGAEDLFRLFLT